MCRLFSIRRKRGTDGGKESKEERQTLPSASPPLWPAQDLPTPEQSSSGSLENLKSQGDDTHRPLVESDSRTPVNSQQWGRRRQRLPNHLREHGDGRRPGRHATVLPREALAKLMDGALGHAVANHPWEMGKKTGQGPLAATGVSKGNHARVQRRLGRREGWASMERVEGT